MDDEDRAEMREAHVANTAIGTVAIQGIVGICAELMDAGVLQRAQLSRISDFMLASLAKSGASASLQSQLHEAIGHQFSSLVARSTQQGTQRQAPEG